GSLRAWLGIAIGEVSPTLSSSPTPVSRRAIKFCLSPLRLPFRHAPLGGKWSQSGIPPVQSLKRSRGNEFELSGAEGRNRTGTSLAGQGILSPLRLPVPPPPHMHQKELSTLLYFTQAPSLPYRNSKIHYFRLLPAKCAIRS